MDKKKILGNYTVRCSLNSFMNGFVFTGNDRETVLQPSTDEIKNFYCSEIDRPVYKDISFLSNNILRIKEARIVTFGAAGLRPSKSEKAANFFISAFKDNDITSEELGSFSFSLDFFNVWEKVNINFIPNNENSNKNYYLGMKANTGYNQITLDDYNINTKYIGETFTPILEMLVDTAGLLDYFEEVV